MSAPLVSVIVPSYRHEAYIAESLRSVADQSYARLELIVIDDASPDATFRVAQRLLATGLAERFEAVALRRRERNGGADQALNDGLKLAGGDYIAILNSDDRFKPTRIETLVAATRERGGEFGFTAVETLNSGEAPAGPYPENVILMQLRQRLAIAREPSVGYALLRQNVAISTGNFFFSRRLGEAIGGFSPLKYCHDWDFILQALLRTEPVFVAAPLYEYRLHPGNSFRSLQHLADLETEVALRRFFREVYAGNVGNPTCPSPQNDAGYFEAFLAHARLDQFWAKEARLPSPGSRVQQVSAARPLETLAAFASLLQDRPIRPVDRARGPGR